MNAPAQMKPGGWWEFPHIGEEADFMDAKGIRYRGRITAIVNGTAYYAAVLGYATAFPLFPVTPAQAAFVLEGQPPAAAGGAT